MSLELHRNAWRSHSRSQMKSNIIKLIKVKEGYCSETDYI